MKFCSTTVILLVATSGLSAVAAPLPSTQESPLQARSFFGDIFGGVKSFLGIGGSSQPQQQAPVQAAPVQEVPQQQIGGVGVPLQGQADPQALAAQQQQQAATQPQQESHGILSTIENFGSNMLGNIGNLFGGGGGEAAIAEEALPLIEEAAPLALVALKQ